MTQTIATCKYCGKAGLIWKRNKDGTYVLTENSIQRHKCKKISRPKI